MTKQEALEVFTKIYKWDSNDYSTTHFINQLYETDADLALFEKKDKWKITNIKKIKDISVIEALKYMQSQIDCVSDLGIPTNKVRDFLEKMEREYRL